MDLKNFLFVDNFCEVENKNCFVGKVPIGVDSVAKLFDFIGDELKFPDYFGFNWNALYDCLRDFSWVDEKNIVLLHGELPRLNDDDLKIYLEILRDAAADWQPDESHKFQIVFPVSDRENVLMLLATS